MRVLLPILLAASAFGCGGSTSSGFEAPTVNVAGTWKGRWTSSTGASGATSSTFTQSATGAISGTTTFSGSPCFSAGKIEGAVTGDDFNGRLVAGGIRVDLAGTTIERSMSGTYNAVSAGACTGDTAGTFTLERTD